MAEIISHIGAFVRLLEVLPEGQITEDGRNVSPTCTRALAQFLDLNPTSINFGKIILWISAFVNDGEDAINRCSLKDGDKKAADRIFSQLTKPFSYPFAGTSSQDHRKTMLTQERRSYMSLLDEVILREYPIYIPDKKDISDLADRLKGLVEKFDEFDIPSYIKADFKRNIDLYILVSAKLPMVAHRLIAEESSRLISWLLSNISDDAKKIVSQAALTINVLVAIFVMPAEAYGAGSSYYKWYSGTFANQPAIEATVAPKALPKPS